MAKSDFIVVSNRLPVRRVKRGGRYTFEYSPGGLVSALMPILKGDMKIGSVNQSKSAWIGWLGAASRQQAFTQDGVRNIPIPLNKAELEGYYEGVSNASLWPLYHDAVRPPRYRRRWWPQYEAVNRRFAEAAAKEAAKGAIVWVHDYHLHLVPGLLREKRPDLKIGFFLHIPFPGRGLFAQLPWRKQLVEGTLGADVVGFQTPYAAQNFVDLARWYAGGRKASGGVRFGDRNVTVKAFPISIDYAKFNEIARSPKVVERASVLRHRLGNRKMLLGVDRLDYTKGIDIRLRAFQDLLEQKRLSIDEVVMIQSAVPTRERVEDYAELRSTVEELVGQINGEYGEVGLMGVQYLRQTLPVEELVSLYVAADVMVVTPLRDGMNLVAKEYIASKHDDSGALILSEFTGAANELGEAYLCNPHDLDGVCNALDAAIHAPPEENLKRMRMLRRQVESHDVFDWARSFLEELVA